MLVLISQASWSGTISEGKGKYKLQGEGKGRDVSFVLII